MLASYARFLWDTEEEEEEGVRENMSRGSELSYFHGASPMPPPLAAAS